MFGVRLHAKSVAYAATLLGTGFINPVFSFYYVKLYLNHFHVSEPWFQFAQIVFMIWNAVNDPLFGCLQDNARSWLVFRSRRHSILYGAPLFVVSFIMIWFPWADYDSSSSAWIAGIQLTFVLCFYDAMFTFVLLAECALFAELSTNQADRVRLVQYSQVADLLGSVSVLVCEATSAGIEHYARFQVTCIGLGLAAGACFVYTGLNADTHFDHMTRPASTESSKDSLEDKPLTGCDEVWMVMRQSRQIFAQRSFVSFILMNFCQIYHKTFLSNFVNIIGDHLLGTGLSPVAKRIFYGSLYIIPQLLVIIGASVVSRVGYYQVIRASFILKIFTGLSLFLIGRDHPWIIAAFFLVESANASATFSLFGLCLSDIIDIDMQQQQRSHPLSSMVFGLNALVTKPAISFAPMITVAVLNSYGYSPSLSTIPGVLTSTVAGTEVQHAATAIDDVLSSAMLYMTCAVPVVVGLLQLVIWRFYTIRDSHHANYMIAT